MLNEMELEHETKLLIVFNNRVQTLHLQKIYHSPLKMPVKEKIKDEMTKIMTKIQIEKITISTKWWMRFLFMEEIEMQYLRE